MVTRAYFLLGLLWASAIVTQAQTNTSEADELADRGQHAEAIALYTRLINTARSIPYEVYMKRGNNYLQLARFAEASADYELALLVPDTYPVARFVKGLSYYGKASICHERDRDYPQAIKYLRKAAGYLPAASIYSTMGYNYMAMGQPQKALKSLNRAVELDPVDAYAYSNRGWAYVRLEKFDLARKDIQTSIRLDPGNPYAYKHHALLYLALNQPTVACENLKKARELNYRSFGHAPDSMDVDLLLEQYCK